MNSLGNCKAEFSSWRFIQLHLVPVEVMDMEKTCRAIISDPGHCSLISAMPRAALSLEGNCSCNHTFFLGIKKRRIFSSFGLYSSKPGLESPKVQALSVGKVKKRFGCTGEKKKWECYVFVEEPMGCMHLEKMKKVYFLRKKAKMDHRMPDQGPNTVSLLAQMF